MKYRVTLGRRRDSINLVANGTFDTDLSGWTASNFVHTAVFGGAASLPAGLGGSITQSNVFQRGEIYEIDFTIQQTSVVPTGVQCGAYDRQFEDRVSGQHTISRRCLGSEDLKFIASGAGPLDFIIDDIAAYKMVWDNPLIDEPIGLEDMDVSFERDSTTYGIFATTSNDIEFWGDGYDYLLDLLQDGFCSEVPILIEKDCGEGFQDYLEGVIYLSDVVFNYDQCTVKATIEDKNIQTLLKAQDIEVPYNISNFTFDNVLPQADISVSMHDTAGAYSYSKTLFLVEEVFRLIVLYATDLQLEFKSNFFSSGTFQYLCISKGYELRVGGLLFDTAEKISFNWLFKELNKVFNLSFTIITENNEPKVQVEQKITFLPLSTFLTLSSVPNIGLSFNPDQFIRTVDIGYKKLFNSDYRDGHQYYTDTECNDDNKDYVSNFIQDSDLIFSILNPITTGTNTSTATESLIDGTAAFLSNKILEGFEVSNTTVPATARVDKVASNTTIRITADIFTGTPENYSITNTKTSYDDDIVIIEVEEDGAGGYQSKQFGASFSYNGNIDYDDNMTRQVETLPTSYNEKLTSGVTTISKTNQPIINIWRFEYPIDDLDHLFILFNKKNQIIFSNSEITVTGWILSYSRNEKTSIAEFELISNP